MNLVSLARERVLSEPVAAFLRGRRLRAPPRQHPIPGVATATTELCVDAWHDVTPQRRMIRPLAWQPTTHIPSSARTPATAFHDLQGGVKSLKIRLQEEHVPT